MSSTEGDLRLFKSRLSPSPSVAFAAPEDRPPLRSCRARVTAQSTTLCHARNRHAVYGRAPGSHRCHHGPAMVLLGNWLEAAGPWVPRAAEGSAGTGALGRSWRCRQRRAETALAASEVCPASTGGGAGWSVQLTQAEGLRSLRPGSSSWEAHCARLLICLSTLTRCRVLAPDHLLPQVKIFLSLLGWTKE